MIEELVFTSSRRGLQPGRTGFCTVASTTGMSAPLHRLLESLSGYRHLFSPGTPESKRNPVVYSNLSTRVGGHNYRILSRICDAGLDYSNRTNKLAHHLAIQEARLPGCGPVTLLKHAQMVRQWEGEPRQLNHRSWELPKTGPKICRTWEKVTGDAGRAGDLLEAIVESKNIYLLVDPETPILEMLDEAFSLLPLDLQWNTTFTTFLTQLPPNVGCKISCVIRGSSEWTAARRNPHNLMIDLTQPLGISTRQYAAQAREGRPIMETPVRPVPKVPTDQGNADSEEVLELEVIEESEEGIGDSSLFPGSLRPAGDIGKPLPPNLNRRSVKTGVRSGKTAGSDSAKETRDHWKWILGAVAAILMLAIGTTATVLWLRPGTETTAVAAGGEEAEPSPVVDPVVEAPNPLDQKPPDNRPPEPLAPVIPELEMADQGNGPDQSTSAPDDRKGQNQKGTESSNNKDITGPNPTGKILATLKSTIAKIFEERQVQGIPNRDRTPPIPDTRPDASTTSNSRPLFSNMVFRVPLSDIGKFPPEQPSLFFESLGTPQELRLTCASKTDASAGTTNNSSQVKLSREEPVEKRWLVIVEETDYFTIDPSYDENKTHQPWKVAKSINYSAGNEDNDFKLLAAVQLQVSLGNNRSVSLPFQAIEKETQIISVDVTKSNEFKKIILPEANPAYYLVPCPQVRGNKDNSLGYQIFTADGIDLTAFYPNQSPKSLETVKIYIQENSLRFDFFPFEDSFWEDDLNKYLESERTDCECISLIVEWNGNEISSFFRMNGSEDSKIDDIRDKIIEKLEKLQEDLKNPMPPKGPEGSTAPPIVDPAPKKASNLTKQVEDAFRKTAGSDKDQKDKDQKDKDEIDELISEIKTRFETFKTAYSRTVIPLALVSEEETTIIYLKFGTQDKVPELSNLRIPLKVNYADVP